MEKSLKILLTDTVPSYYVFNANQIVSAYVASATTFNVITTASLTPIVFAHETDAQHLCFKAFVAALDKCGNPKSNPSPVVMEIPTGFTMDLG